MKLFTFSLTTRGIARWSYLHHGVRLAAGVITAGRPIPTIRRQPVKIRPLPGASATPGSPAPVRRRCTKPQRRREMDEISSNHGVNGQLKITVYLQDRTRHNTAGMLRNNRCRTRCHGCRRKSRSRVKVKKTIRTMAPWVSICLPGRITQRSSNILDYFILQSETK